MTIGVVQAVRFVRAGTPYIARVDGGYVRTSAPEDGYEVKLADATCFVSVRELAKARRVRRTV